MACRAASATAPVARKSTLARDTGAAGSPHSLPRRAPGAPGGARADGVPIASCPPPAMGVPGAPAAGPSTVHSPYDCIRLIYLYMTMNWGWIRSDDETRPRGACA